MKKRPTPATTITHNMTTKEMIRLVDKLKRSGHVNTLATIEANHPEREVRKAADKALRELITVQKSDDSAWFELERTADD